MSRLLLKTSSLLIFLFFTFFRMDLSFANNYFIKRDDVRKFIAQMVKKHHFKKQSLITLFKMIEVRPQVIQNVNKPFEKQPWHLYQMLFVNRDRIENGVKFWNKYAKALQKAERTYGIPASIIVATIGIETKYGKRTGEFRVIDSLANLAFSSSSRAVFFRNELEQFLLLTREEGLNPLEVKGSYAGAIGQPQFMPSSYRNFAVNFSNSGKTDLMHNEVDVIGSIANYYKKHGWEMNGLIAVEAYKLGDRYPYLKRNNKINHPLTIGSAAGLGIIARSRLPDHLAVKVIELTSHYSKEYWLGFHNFDVIKRYNASDLYAMAVYQLSNFLEIAKKQQGR